MWHENCLLDSKNNLKMDKFENIKIGNKVIVWNRHYDKQVASVIKVNKTSFICQCDGFTITFTFSGRERGGDAWSSWYCDVWTQEMEDKIIERDKKIKYIKYLKKLIDTEINSYSVEEIESILMCIKNIKENKK